MRTTALCLAALIGLPAVATAQQPSAAHVGIHFDIPVVLPRLVVVAPGIQVVPQVREEVFFHEGWYWVRRDAVWYRSRDHRGGWVLVPGPAVPTRFGALPPPGHYRNWKAEKAAAKAERKAAKRAEKYERRHDDHDHDHDHDRDHDRGGGHGRGKHKDKH